MKQINILITGSAGFIGFHLSRELIKLKKYKIYGIDNLNNYYSVKLKKERLKILKNNKNFFFKKENLENFESINNYIKQKKISVIIHLAAQAGVRFSIKNPKNYFDSNLLGFFNILEASRLNKIKYLMFASSSSVYGNNPKRPSSEKDFTDTPIQFYAATKKSNEVMAYAYSKVYGIKMSGLRFFTVYGPWGRPDMAYYKFVDKIQKNREIKIFNYGKHSRDFTYIDDAVKIVIKLLHKEIINIKKKSLEIYNVSSSKNVKLFDFINELEKNLQKKSRKKFIKKQIGDIKDTLSSNLKVQKQIGKINFTNYKKGIKEFINWYKFYNGK